MRWVEVVGVEVAAVMVLGVVVDVDQVGWAADRPPDLAATAFAPIADTRSRTKRERLVSRSDAPSAVSR